MEIYKLDFENESKGGLTEQTLSVGPFPDVLDNPDHNDKMAKIESVGVVKNNQTLLDYPVPNDINQQMTEISDFAPTTQNLMGLKDLKSTKFDLTQKTIFCIDRDQFITKNCLSDKFIYEWPPPRHGKEGTSMISEESRST